MLGYGLILMVGASSGQGTLLRPLPGGFSGTGEHQGGLAFRPIKDLGALQAALVTATTQGRPIMLDYYADWCISCKEMARYTFTDPRVQTALGDTLLLQADVTAFNAEDKILLKQFGLHGPPGDPLLLTSGGRTFCLSGYRFHQRRALRLSCQTSTR